MSRQQDLKARPLRSLSTSAVEDPRSAPFHLCQSGTHPDDTMLVERLRMVQPSPFTHRPVMLDEIIEWFAPVPAGVLIDATVGGAGHSVALLQRLPQLKVLGIDQDPLAIEVARERLTPYGARADVRRARFDDLAGPVAEVFPGEPVVAVLFDLGVSSPQLDIAERGFSYRQSGPLDMRMDTDQPLSAAGVVNDYDVETLGQVLRAGGEEQFAWRIANAIVQARPLHTTEELAQTVRNAIPPAGRRRKGDPAKRTFQAIRLEVNNELPTLQEALNSAQELIVAGGRLVTLAYHSGEDTLIKQQFLHWSTGGCTCPVDLPCVCGAEPLVRVLTRGSRKPSIDEVSTNPRSESARLRAIEVLRRPEADNADPRNVQ